MTPRGMSGVIILAVIDGIVNNKGLSLSPIRMPLIKKQAAKSAPLLQTPIPRLKPKNKILITQCVANQITRIPHNRITVRIDG